MPISLELTPTVAPKNRFGRGVGFEPMIGSGGERSSARSRWAAGKDCGVPVEASLETCSSVHSGHARNRQD
jgi:hypothetical protein